MCAELPVCFSIRRIVMVLALPYPHNGTHQRGSKGIAAFIRSLVSRWSEYFE